MTPDLKPNSEVELTPLITGIIEDAYTLVAQQLTLFQSELKDDLVRTREAVIPFALGMAVCLLAGFFLFMTVVSGLQRIWPQLPEYAAYGIVGLFLGIVGTALLLVGKTKFDAFDILPAKSLPGLKEKSQWTTKN